MKKITNTKGHATQYSLEGINILTENLCFRMSRQYRTIIWRNKAECQFIQDLKINQKHSSLNSKVITYVLTPTWAEKNLCFKTSVSKEEDLYKWATQCFAEELINKKFYLSIRESGRRVMIGINHSNSVAVLLRRWSPYIWNSLPFIRSQSSSSITPWYC